MKYDIVHFEALGTEAKQLENETDYLIEKQILPEDFKTLITPLTIQDYLKKTNISLPDIITTKTHSILPHSYINSGCKKNLITRSTGYEHCKQLSDKVNITTLRNYCTTAVAQTSIKFVYCTTGHLNEYIKNTTIFERNQTTSFMELNKDRTVTIYGAGQIGKKIHSILTNNGLSVQMFDDNAKVLSELKSYQDIKFVSKQEAAQNSDIVINARGLIKDKDSPFYNVNDFNEEYLLSFKNPIYFINITRGEIAPESTLLKLYNKKKILGLGLDVFSYESELTERLEKNNFKDCTNVDILAAKKIIELAITRQENFYVQPHQAFNSKLAAKAKARDTMRHVLYYLKNNKNGFEFQLPYF